MMFWTLILAALVTASTMTFSQITVAMLFSLVLAYAVSRPETPGA